MPVTKNRKKQPAARQIRKKRGICKYPGIGQDAEILGTNRSYLWTVLEGRATSAPLLARYRELKARQAKAAAKKSARRAAR